MRNITLLAISLLALEGRAVIESGSIPLGNFKENGVHYSIKNVDWTSFSETVDGVTYTYHKCEFRLSKTGCTICEMTQTTNLVVIDAITVAKDISIPATLGGMRVIWICDAFSGNDVVESLTFPDSLPALPTSAFNGCTALKHVRLPKELDIIGGFRGCTALTSISIPTTVRHVGSGFLMGTKFWEGSPIVILDGCVLGCSTDITQADYDQLVAARTDLRIIADCAFEGQPNLRSVRIPEGVVSIGDWAFDEDHDDIDSESILTNLVLSSTLKTIGENAFQNCDGITELSIPANLESIGNEAFCGCYNLKTVSFESTSYFESMWEEGNYEDSFGPSVKTLLVPSETDARRLRRLLNFIANDARENDNNSLWYFYDMVVRVRGSAESSVANQVATLLTTNVVLHYVVNSVVPEKVYPATNDTGFVNIITEVKSGGAVSVPATWMGNYSGYMTKFGTDFTKSLMKLTGKRDGAGNAMCVWQDYVAGTDPTDENDKFTASITIDADGNLIISYSPELTDAEKALRVYKTWGKVKLQDTDWVEVPEGHNADYNFFKVSVEMK